MDVEWARWDNSGIFHIRGYQHKTAKSYGPVCLILDRRVGRILLNYMKDIRILVPGYRKTNRALLTSKGTDITNYKNYVSNFLAKFELPQLPTIITDTRKTVATMVVESGNPAKLEVLFQRMSHNVTTSKTTNTHRDMFIYAHLQLVPASIDQAFGL